jgi:uncharacterized protein (TIGR03437 family)
MRDFSPVTATKPAHAGDLLIVRATGLGPTVPSVEPGQPFPTTISDGLWSGGEFAVDISVNGQPAQVINATGWLRSEPTRSLCESSCMAI